MTEQYQSITLERQEPWDGPRAPRPVDGLWARLSGANRRARRAHLKRRAEWEAAGRPDRTVRIYIPRAAIREVPRTEPGPLQFEITAVPSWR